jgi:hypothetical protein
MSFWSGGHGQESCHEIRNLFRKPPAVWSKARKIQRRIQKLVRTQGDALPRERRRQAGLARRRPS